VTVKGEAHSVQPDLQGLEISPGELRHLSGVDSTEVFRPSILHNPKQRWSFLFQEFLLSLALTPIIVGLLHVFVILPLIGASLPATLVTLVSVPIAIVATRWFWLQRNSPTALCCLLDEVDRYNAVIKAIHINDQLEAAGTRETSLSDRVSEAEPLGSALLRFRSRVNKPPSADCSIPSIFFIANGECLPLLFSQRLTVRTVTSNLAANFSSVSPKYCRRTRIKVSLSSCRPTTNISFALLDLLNGRYSRRFFLKIAIS
jgi:hypothetical protein